MYTGGEAGAGEGRCDPLFRANKAAAVSGADAGWCGDGGGLRPGLAEGVGDGVTEAEGRARACCDVPGLGAVARPGGGEDRVVDPHVDRMLRFRVAVRAGGAVEPCRAVEVA